MTMSKYELEIVSVICSTGKREGIASACSLTKSHMRAAKVLQDAGAVKVFKNPTDGQTVAVAACNAYLFAEAKWEEMHLADKIGFMITA